MKDTKDEVKQTAPARKTPAPVLKQTAADIFNRVVKQVGKSVFVHDEKTTYKTQEEAAEKFKEATEKTTW